MFQGLEVVPVKFADKVIDLIKSGKGIEVHRYLVPLPYWKFFALKINSEKYLHTEITKHLLLT